MKRAFPEQIILLRGNHEDRNINSEYGFRQLLKDRFGEQDGEYLWGMVNNMFLKLPLLMIVAGHAIVHAGLPAKPPKRLLGPCGPQGLVGPTSNHSDAFYTQL